MLCREIIAVCSQIHTKPINTVCGQNVELLNVKLVVHIVTTGLQRVKLSYMFLDTLTSFISSQSLITSRNTDPITPRLHSVQHLVMDTERLLLSDPNSLPESGSRSGLRNTALCLYIVLRTQCRVLAMLWTGHFQTDSPPPNNQPPHRTGP
jgi:hypothetical protein